MRLVGKSTVMPKEKFFKIKMQVRDYEILKIEILKTLKKIIREELR